jgi:hypothetical protein
LTERDPPDDDKAKPTHVGCVLTLLSVAVIVGVAVPIAHWRDPATGQPPPRMVAILAPILIGAAFHGMGTFLLRLVGLRTWSKPETGAPPRSRGPDDPLGRIKQDYETLTERERRELLDFIQDDLRRRKPRSSGGVPPPVPPEGYTP